MPSNITIRKLYLRSRADACRDHNWLVLCQFADGLTGDENLRVYGGLDCDVTIGLDRHYDERHAWKREQVTLIGVVLS